ncbi:MAG TPA: adenylate/guanylate cyclase domain-containing protein [Polyangiales bacterium]|nr:adenylate/guanylate cyclase domain-containing protein [Polyangiales bacterium]
MTAEPLTRLRNRAQSGDLIESGILSTVAPIDDVPAFVPPPSDALPVIQWLSEAVQLHVQASFDVLRARLRFARERLRDGRSSQTGDEALRLTTLLATDMEAFTPMLERLGDSRAQQLMHAHNEILRSCLRRNHGREVAHTGDGVLASFRSPVHAMRCAIAMQRRLQAHNLENPGTPLRIRIGLHAGVPLPEEDRLFGACVNVTVRVCSVAKPGAILASEVVLRLLEGQSVFRFIDRGSVALKGIRIPRQLHEVVWQLQAAPALPVTLN